MWRRLLDTLPACRWRRPPFAHRHDLPGSYFRPLVAWIAAGVLACFLCFDGMPGLAQTRPAAQRVAIVFESKAPYRTAVEAAAATLRAAGRECVSVELSTGDDAARTTAWKKIVDAKSAIILAAGSTAVSQAFETLPGVPVVFCMAPNALDAAFLSPDSPAKDRIAGVASDIDPAEQVEWIIRTSPRAKKVGILHSSRSVKTATAIQEAGKKRGLELTLIATQHDEFPRAVETLDRQACDGVLMIPDAQVFNAANVEHLLLWGVRQKKPVWTFSENVVKAGAFAGLYCDSSEVGRQAAAIVEDVLDGKKPAVVGLRHPQVVRRAINVHTIEMIGKPIDEKTLSSDVVRLGEQP
jgi:ABC-type uncharacterized transport system substrate-binding protein